MRTDAGLSQEELARAAGVSQAFVARVEAATLHPTIESYAALAAALGADLALRIYPNTGPQIRDRHQAPIVEALLALLHPRWRAVPEVPVRAPTRGVVDVTLHDPGPPSVLVAAEVESEIRRLEQRLRWHAEKAQALASSDVWRLIRDEDAASPVVSRLLVVRSTRSNRDLARRFEQTLVAAHPARAVDAYAALTGVAPWPGSALIWAVVDGGAARILDAPPRGVRLGR
jgi:transcriptional regulator with XRE-family HTH domain